MKTTFVNYGSNPKQILSDPYDAIWVLFTPRKAPSPILAESLQWIDWKLQGQLSRFLLGETGERADPTFLHTMGKLGVPYVVLEAGSQPERESLKRNCEGLRLKRVLLFVEDVAKVAGVEQLLSSTKWEALPEEFVLGCEEAPEKGASNRG